MVKNFEREIEKLIRRSKVCVLGSVDVNGYPNSKALFRPRKILGVKTFYLPTSIKSEHVSQVASNPRTSLYFFKRWFGFKGVLLVGNAEIITDTDVKEMLWEKKDLKIFAGGVTDPDYCVLKFTCINGRIFSKRDSQNFVVEGDKALSSDF
ncbi:MAG: pyridoxamine 5'-phosphate oxidase family protein [Ruminococcaceae bacterium]|nr:pyridoxamine 5'-phosphate oxidase family protein [Oscillospiraceae bacterium]